MYDKNPCRTLVILVECKTRNDETFTGITIELPSEVLIDTALWSILSSICVKINESIVFYSHI